MRSGLAAGQQGRCVRLHRDDADRRILLLQIPAGAGERAARSDGRHKNIHLPARVLPDFRAGGLVVGFRIVRVRELAGHEAAGNFGGERFGLFHRALHSLRPGREHQLCAVGGEQAAPLLTHAVRHGEDDAVAARTGDRRKADAGVAAGRLDDDGAGTELALGLCAQDHLQCDAVLGAAGGVHALQLHEDRRAQTTLFRKLPDLQQRGVADQLRDAVIHVHSTLLSHKTSCTKRHAAKRSKRCYA